MSYVRNEPKAAPSYNAVDLRRIHSVDSWVQTYSKSHKAWCVGSVVEVDDEEEKCLVYYHDHTDNYKPFHAWVIHGELCSIDCRAARHNHPMREQVDYSYATETALSSHEEAIAAKQKADAARHEAKTAGPNADTLTLEENATQLEDEWEELNEIAEQDKAYASLKETDLNIALKVKRMNELQVQASEAPPGSAQEQQVTKAIVTLNNLLRLKKDVHKKKLQFSKLVGVAAEAREALRDAEADEKDAVNGLSLLPQNEVGEASKRVAEMHSNIESCRARLEDAVSAREKMLASVKEAVEIDAEAQRQADLAHIDAIKNKVSETLSEKKMAEEEYRRTQNPENILIVGTSEARRRAQMADERALKAKEEARALRERQKDAEREFQESAKLKKGSTFLLMAGAGQKKNTLRTPAIERSRQNELSARRLEEEEKQTEVNLVEVKQRRQNLKGKAAALVRSRSLSGMTIKDIHESARSAEHSWQRAERDRRRSERRKSRDMHRAKVDAERSQRDSWARERAERIDRQQATKLTIKKSEERQRTLDLHTRAVELAKHRENARQQSPPSLDSPHSSPLLVEVSAAALSTQSPGPKSLGNVEKKRIAPSSPNHKFLCARGNLSTFEEQKAAKALHRARRQCGKGNFRSPTYRKGREGIHSFRERTTATLWSEETRGIPTSVDDSSDIPDGNRYFTEAMNESMKAFLEPEVSPISKFKDRTATDCKVVAAELSTMIEAQRKRVKSCQTEMESMMKTLLIAQRAQEIARMIHATAASSARALSVEKLHHEVNHRLAGEFGKEELIEASHDLGQIEMGDIREEVRAVLAAVEAVKSSVKSAREELATDAKMLKRLGCHADHLFGRVNESCKRDASPMLDFDASAYAGEHSFLDLITTEADVNADGFISEDEFHSAAKSIIDSASMGESNVQIFGTEGIAHDLKEELHRLREHQDDMIHDLKVIMAECKESADEYTSPIRHYSRARLRGAGKILDPRKGPNGVNGNLELTKKRLRRLEEDTTPPSDFQSALISDQLALAEKHARLELMSEVETQLEVQDSIMKTNILRSRELHALAIEVRGKVHNLESDVRRLASLARKIVSTSLKSGGIHIDRILSGEVPPGAEGEAARKARGKLWITKLHLKATLYMDAEIGLIVLFRRVIAEGRLLEGLQ